MNITPGQYFYYSTDFVGDQDHPLRFCIACDYEKKRVTYLYSRDKSSSPKLYTNSICQYLKILQFYVL